MQKTDFGPRFPGRLERLEDGVSFIPEPLPPKIPPDWAIHAADERARGALGEFIGHARNVRNQSLVTRPLMTREAVESNKIENTITTAADVLLQEAGERAVDPERAKDNEEVLRYQYVLGMGAADVQSGRPLSLHLIKSLHAELLRFTRGEHRRPGEFRRENVLIGREADSYGTARFVPPLWAFVDPAMEDMERFMTGAPVYSPLISAALVHYQLETIHPFLDGNGRLGRLLIPLYLVSQGVVDRPIIYLSPYFERHRSEYVDRLKRTSTHGEWEEWVLFFLRAIEEQARSSQAIVSAITTLHNGYRELVRTRGSGKAILPALDLVMERVIVTVQGVADYARCTYNTAKTAVDGLVRLGILTPLPGSYPQRWWARELIDAGYGDGS